MSLRDKLVKLADENPDLIIDLMPLLDIATGASCCRKVAVASERVLRRRTFALIAERPDLQPFLGPLIAP